MQNVLNQHVTKGSPWLPLKGCDTHCNCHFECGCCTGNILATSCLVTAELLQIFVFFHHYEENLG